MAKPKQISGIDCDAEATAAIRRVVTVRLGEMCGFRERALDENDPEGVHDMRVASRRLRSALRDFMPYARKRRIANSLKGIKEIADALGQVRDQDVAIIALEKLATKAPPKVSSGIQQLADIRRAKRIAAREELIPILDEACLTQLHSDFLPAVEAAIEPVASRRKSARGASAAARPSYRAVARATILDRLKELEKLSDSLYHPLKVKPLHKMRIAAKRLRYALELFEKCWGRKLAPFSTRVAALQSSLGELHDCDVWIVEFGDELSGKGRQSAENGTGDSERGAASIWLLDHFVKQRTKHLRSALARWRDWETSDRSEQLRKIVQLDSSASLASHIATNAAKAPRKAGSTSRRSR
ncbi:MAG: CHAD domain-containing protein [Pyrinomonadaceae bacterium]|nr:CHAD domain-containing protein [Pyrinomonadaceae bacterium]